MSQTFPNNLGTYTKRGALIGAVALGLITLFAGGGFLPIIFFGLIGAAAGGIIASTAEPKSKKRYPDALQRQSETSAEEGISRQQEHAGLDPDSQYWQRRTGVEEANFRQEEHEQREERNLYRHDNGDRGGSRGFHSDRVRDSQQDNDMGEGRDR